jgi:multiple sugar transport system permease protein
MSDDGTKSGVLGLEFGTEERLYRILQGISATVVVVVGVFPILWMLQNSLLPRRTVLEGPVFLPSLEAFSPENYAVIFSGDILLYFTNTVIVTIGTIISVCVISLIAGYGLARFRWSQKENFARFLLFGYMFSPIVLGLPLYLIWRELGLLNTRIGLIIALTAISMPFSVWLMWKYIQTIPPSMEESAWVAGASRFRGFREVVVPQTKPAIVAAALFAFAISWNDFTFAQILLPRNEATTFAPGIMRLVNQGYNVGWNEIMAISMAMTLPPLLFAYFLQGYLLKGFEIRSL